MFFIFTVSLIGLIILGNYYLISLAFFSVTITVNYTLIFYIILLSLGTLIPLLISIAFFTLAERKIMASIQRRKGPNVVGF